MHLSFLCELKSRLRQREKQNKREKKPITIPFKARKSIDSFMYGRGHSLHSSFRPIFVCFVKRIYIYGKKGINSYFQHRKLPKRNALCAFRH